MHTKNSSKMKHPGAVAAARGILLGFGLLGAFLMGFLLRGNLVGASSGAEERYLLLYEVQDLITQHYLRPLPDQVELEYSAIQGMVGALQDPYTFFNPPPVARSESDALAGQYGGIGVDVQYAADGRFVLYPYADTPAAEAGIEDGDVLLAAAGQEILAGTSLDEVRQLLRGEVSEGNGVRVRLLKHTTGEVREYEVMFAMIAVPSVVWRMLLEEPRFGYIQINLFTSRTPEEVRNAVAELSDLSAEALILDLRNNPGGLLQESVDTADVFLADGIIYYEHTQDTVRERAAQNDGLEPALPVIVLVNQRTASAAELVAGALQENGQALVIGQTTTGKGSVQLIFPLSDGSSIHVTSAEWFTPDHGPLDGNGLQPDIPMIPADDGRDVELDEAVRHLRDSLAGRGS
jgi:carboxyl-terminal processing protease